jgi:hypothetical protein
MGSPGIPPAQLTRNHNSRNGKRAAMTDVPWQNLTQSATSRKHAWPTRANRKLTALGRR